MQWSDPTNHQGIIQQAYFYAFGDTLDHSSDFPLTDVTAHGNIWYANVGLAIWKANKIWEWDDANQTTLSVATTNLVNGQSDYSLPTSILHVAGAAVLDVSGNWETLTEIDPREVMKATGIDWDYYQSVAALPAEYALYDNSVWLKPPPDNGVSVTLAAGLKLWVSRSVTTFSVPASYSTADTTVPGFDSSFHWIVPMGIAHEYLMANGQESKAMGYLSKMTLGLKELARAFETRNEDKPNVVKPRRENYE